MRCLTRLLADEAIGEILLDQARRFPERRELLEAHGLQCFAIGNHLVGQAVCAATGLGRARRRTAADR